MGKLIPVPVIPHRPAMLLAGSTLTPHVTKPKPAATPCPSCPAGDLDTFDMKTGLWRIDMTSDMSGLAPMTPATLAHTTPQKRALFAAMANWQGRERSPARTASPRTSCPTTPQMPPLRH